MNAQQLINETPVSHFDFKVFFKSSKVNKPRFLDTSNSDNKGDRFLGMKGNKHLSGGLLPSLPLRTFNYSKLNTARRNLEWQQAEKELGLIQL